MFGSGLQAEHAFGTVSGVARTRVRRRRLGASLLLIGLAVVFLRATPGSARPSGSSAAHAVRYVVRPGDTLWSIARRLAPSEDPRRLVDELGRRNDVDPGHLIPGQTIVVPPDV
jgi:LysM domain